MSPGGLLPGLDTGLLLPMAIALMALAAALIVGALVAQLLRLRPARSWPELPQLLHEALAKSPLAEAACLPARNPAGESPPRLPRADGVHA